MATKAHITEGKGSEPLDGLTLAKDSSKNKLSDLGADARADLVVPIPVEFIALDIDAFEFFIGDLDSRRIGFRIEFGVNLEAGGGGCGGDEAHDSLETAQGLAVQFWLM